MQITNEHNISLPLQIWLLYDDYDYNYEENYISATSLLRSTKQIILSKQVQRQDLSMDVAEKIASSFGNAVHDSVEKAWRTAGPQIMKRLGYPDHVVQRIVVNPSDEYLTEHPDCLPVYFEKRAVKEINGYKVGGKFDTVIDGQLFDYKTTSVYSYLKGNKDEDYAMQGSIYRWLNPELITGNHIFIQFIFTDWQKFMIKNNDEYPKVKIKEYPVELLSIEDTEKFIVNKLNELSSLWNKSEEELPPCSDKELWRSEPQYKYYSDPTKTDGRSTRNFDNLHDANKFMSEKGGKGIVKTIPGEVKACAYCPAFTVCKQKDQYYA